MIEHLVDNPWLWLALAVLLAIAEIVTPGVFLIFVAVAAALTGIAAMLISLPAAIQFLLFALFSLVSVAVGRRWYAADDKESQDPLLNDRTARLIGETVMVAQAIRHGKGRVTVGDSVWDCSGEDADEGATVRVTGARGSVLLVEPV